MSAHIAAKSTLKSALRRPLTALFLVLLCAAVGLISLDVTATYEISMLGQAEPSAPQTAAIAPATADDEMPTELYREFAAALQEDASPEYDVTAGQDRDGAIYQATNPATGLNAGFGSQGIQVTQEESAAWSLHMSLTAYGYDGHTAAVPSTELATAGNRVEYRYDGLGLTEWYVNGPMGLEQGFTLDTPPAGPRKDELRLDVALSGGLTPALDADENGIIFTTADGSAVISYNGLYAYDATGRELPAYLTLTDDGFAILVDDKEAVYPVTVDPWVQQVKLEASDGGAGDEFGNRVDIDGDTAVVGARYHDLAAGDNAGAAYVFTRSGSVWSQQAKLVADDAAAFDNFGYSVAISGETIVIGARLVDNAGVVDAGAAYVFTRSGGTWSQQQKLEASDPGTSDQFGIYVAISGETAVIGAGQDDTAAAGVNAGSAYVFTRSGSTWSQQQKLEASDAGAGDLFGGEVGVDADSAIIGARGDDTLAGDNAGSAYVFTRSGGTWSEQQKLEASDPAAGDLFGDHVAVDVDTVVISARRDDDNGTDTGSVYVFTRSGSTWSQQQKLAANGANADDLFGRSVAVETDTLVVGAKSATGPDFPGAAYVFTRSGVTWSQQQKLEASDAGTNDLFGNAVAISGGTVIVGSTWDDTTAGTDAGSAYIFCAVCYATPSDGLGLLDSVQISVAVSKGVSESLVMAESADLGLPQADQLGVTDSVQLVVSIAAAETVDLSESATLSTTKGGGTLIANGSFENGTDPGAFTVLSAGSTAITDWQVTDDNIAYIGTTWSDDADGVRSITPNAPGAIAQSFTTVPDQAYLVTFAMAGNPCGATIKELRVSAAGQSQDFTFDSTGYTGSNMGWRTEAWSFTATGTVSTLTFTGLSPSGGCGPALDNVIVHDTETLTLADAVSFDYFDSLGLTDSVQVAMTTAPVEAVSLTDSVRLVVTMAHAEAVSLTESAGLGLPQADQLALTESVQLVVSMAPAEALTLSESARVAVSKYVSDSIGLADSISFDYFDALGLMESAQVAMTTARGEIVSLTDSVQLAISTVAADVMSMTDAVVLGLERADSLSLTETAQVSVGKAPADSLSTTDTAQMATAKVIGDSMGLTETVQAVMGKTTGDSLGLTDTVSLNLGKTDSINITETVQSATGKAANDSLGVTDAVALELGKSDALSVTESVQAATGKAVGDGLGMTDAVALELGRADSLTLTETIQLATGRAASDALGLTDTVALNLSRADALSITEAVQLATSKAVGDGLGVTDAVALEFGKADSLTLTETTQMATGRAASDALGLTDTVVLNLSKADALSITETTQAIIGKAAADSIGITDDVALSLGKSEALGITETAQLATSKAGNDGLNLTDTVILELGIADSLTLADTAKIAMGKVTGDELSLTDAVALSLGKTETLTITDTATLELGIADSLTLADTVQAAMEKGTSDELGLTDTVALDITKSDALSVTENPQMVFGKDANDGLGITDAVVLTTAKVVGDMLSIADVVAPEFANAATEQINQTVADAITLDDSIAVGITRATVPTPPAPAPQPSSGGAAYYPLPATRTLTETTYDSLGVADAVALSIAYAEAVGVNASLTKAVPVATGKTVEDGLGLTDSVSLTTTLMATVDLGIADLEAESMGQAIVRMARIDLEAAGKAIVEAAIDDAEALRQGVIEAVKIDTEITQAALDAGVANDADALAVLGTAVNVDAFLTEAAPVEGIDPVSGAFWASLGSSESIVRVFAQFAERIPGAEITIDHYTSLPEGVQPFASDQVVNQYVRMTPQRFQDDDIQIAHVTFSVEKSWLAVNGIHPWGVQINRYDEATGIWKAYAVKLVGQDEERVYYTVTPTEFSLWALSGTADVLPIQVRVDDLGITPGETVEGRDITVQAQVSNIGTAQANYNAVLWLNERVYASQAMAVPVGGTMPVTFTLQLSAGIYTVRVDRLLEDLHVGPGSVDVESEVSSPTKVPQSAVVELEIPSPKRVPQSADGESGVPPPTRVPQLEERGSLTQHGVVVWVLMAIVTAGVLLVILGLTFPRIRKAWRSKRSLCSSYFRDP